MLYSFPGPIFNFMGWEVELRALHHVCLAIKKKVSPLVSCCIATDFKIICDNLRKNKANLLQLDNSTQYLHDNNCMENINVVLIKRVQNGDADRLAKEGADRSSILSGWG